VIRPSHLLLVSGVLFMAGMMAVASRRCPLITLLGVELMLHAATLALAALTAWFQDWGGQVAVIAIATIASVELAVGLGYACAHKQQEREPLEPDV